MRFENIELEELQIAGDGVGSYYIPATDELVQWTNDTREQYGFTDLVGVDYDNDVYYDYYLIFNSAKKEFNLSCTCNHGEKDDYAVYDIPLFAEEKEMLMFKVINELTKEIGE